MISILAVAVVFGSMALVTVFATVRGVEDYKNRRAHKDD